MIFIVPKFAKMFDEMLGGEPLPGLTEFVLAISRFMVTSWYWGILGFGVIVVSFKAFKSTAFGSYFIDLVAIKMPPFAGLVQKSTVARFCATLGTLMQSGVSVLNALLIVRDTAGNAVVSKAVQVVHDAVKEGENMAKPMENTRAFPIMVVSMVEVGEETGALPEMLGRIAKVYEEEGSRATITSSPP
jgi:type IV pilus assembly protein PilC